MHSGIAISVRNTCDDALEWSIIETALFINLQGFLGRSGVSQLLMNLLDQNQNVLSRFACRFWNRAQAR